MERPGNNRWKDLLAIHVADRWGGALLLLSILGLGLAILHQHRKGPDPEEMRVLEARMAAWATARDSARTEAQGPRAHSAGPREVSRFPFDPHTATDEDLARLGLLPRQVKALRNYLAHGGHFDSKAEFSRFRAIDAARMEMLLPLVLLPDEAPHIPRARRHHPALSTYPDSVPRFNRYPVAPRRQLELNSCDSVALVALPGIGPVYARAILRHRDRLGGFRSLDQLAEIRLFQDRPEALDALLPALAVDTLLVRAIPINTCTVEELAAHPYVSWQVAKALLAYRTHHGPFSTVEAVRGCHLIDEDLYRKLAPYLSAE